MFKTKDEAKKYEQIMRERAYASVPEEYHSFLRFLGQKVKIAGGSEIYINLPYMTVDGRIRWARDEHRALDKKLHIKTRLCQIGDRLFVVAEVESEAFGSATGMAEVQVSDRGVNATNPLENAETSAVGRALGNLGYGLIGTGLASADEVADARARETVRERNEKVTPFPATNQGTSVDNSDELSTVVIAGRVLGMREGVSPQKGIRYLAVAIETDQGSRTVYFTEDYFELSVLNLQPNDEIITEVKVEQNVLIVLSFRRKGVA